MECALDEGMILESAETSMKWCVLKYVLLHVFCHIPQMDRVSFTEVNMTINQYPLESVKTTTTLFETWKYGKWK